jgi:hypothetical protein
MNIVKKMLPLLALLLVLFPASATAENGTSLAPAFQREVDMRLDLPPEEQTYYAQLLKDALTDAGVALAASQYLLLLDRNPHVQAILLYWFDPGQLHFIGASPVSTGNPGGFDHFVTPQGVFAHTLENLDYRAEGTPNKLGVRGFGAKGMRVFDFGWAQGERGWGRGGTSQMRLLMHATDPELLEHHLCEPKSKGCIRIPSTLDSFIDRYGLLDADYEQAQAKGKKFWVIRPERTPTPWSGRYLVIVDSGRLERPTWSLCPVPPQPHKSISKPQ